MTAIDAAASGAQVAVDRDKWTRKVVSIPTDLWERIDDLRFRQRFRTDADVLRRLLESGLAVEERRERAAERRGGRRPPGDGRGPGRRDDGGPDDHGHQGRSRRG